jgi:hypothetical protein
MICNGQTRPLVWEGAPQRQDNKFQTQTLEKKAISVQASTKRARNQDILTDWLSAVKWLWRLQVKWDFPLISAALSPVKVRNSSLIADSMWMWRSHDDQGQSDRRSRQRSKLSPNGECGLRDAAWRLLYRAQSKRQSCMCRRPSLSRATSLRQAGSNGMAASCTAYPWRLLESTAGGRRNYYQDL